MKKNGYTSTFFLYIYISIFILAVPLDSMTRETFTEKVQ